MNCNWANFSVNLKGMVIESIFYEILAFLLILDLILFVYLRQNESAENWDLYESITKLKAVFSISSVVKWVWKLTLTVKWKFIANKFLFFLQNWGIENWNVEYEKW